MSAANVKRRQFIFGALSTALAVFGGSRLLPRIDAAPPRQSPSGHGASHGDGVFGTMGEVDHARNGFHPSDLLVDFNYGDRVYEENGRTVREYNLVAVDKEIEIAPGLFFPAWTYNGRIPGPTIRCTEGDLLRIHFVNAGSHPHTIPFHGIHAAVMDGIPALPGMPFETVGPGMIQPGDSFTYEFVAEPFGCHLYHCHAIPLKRHIHKGLYGAFIVDPPEGRPEAKELVMVMNGFDTNFDDENEIYAVNTIAFAYNNDVIPLKMGERVRLYLINVTEFDLINSFHLQVVVNY